MVAIILQILGVTPSPVYGKICKKIFKGYLIFTVGIDPDEDDQVAPLWREMEVRLKSAFRNPEQASRAGQGDGDAFGRGLGVECSRIETAGQ